MNHDTTCTPIEKAMEPPAPSILEFAPILLSHTLNYLLLSRYCLGEENYHPKEGTKDFVRTCLRRMMEFKKKGQKISLGEYKKGLLE